MQAFNVNRNSWHYKLNKNFINETSMNVWEYRHRSFCAYWRATMFRLVGAVLSAIGVVWFFGMIAYNIWMFPLAAVIAVGIMLLFGATGWAIFGILTWLERRSTDSWEYEKPAKQDSLFVQKYKSYKDKFCPTVDFKE